MSTYNYTILDQRVLLNIYSTLYTVSSAYTLIKTIILSNNDLSNNVSFTMWIVKPGGTPDNSSCIAQQMILSPGEPCYISPELFLPTGGTIVGVASVTGKISCTISGCEVT